MEDKLVSLKMPVSLITKVKELAQKNSITFSAQVRLILIDYINNITNEGENE